MVGIEILLWLSQSLIWFQIVCRTFESSSRNNSYTVSEHNVYLQQLLWSFHYEWTYLISDVLLRGKNFEADGIIQLGKIGIQAKKASAYEDRTLKVDTYFAYNGNIITVDCKSSHVLSIRETHSKAVHPNFHLVNIHQVMTTTTDLFLYDSGSFSSMVKTKSIQKFYTKYLRYGFFQGFQEGGNSKRIVKTLFWKCERK